MRLKCLTRRIIFLEKNMVLMAQKISGWCLGQCLGDGVNEMEDQPNCLFMGIAQTFEAK